MDGRSQQHADDGTGDGWRPRAWAWPPAWPTTPAAHVAVMAAGSCQSSITDVGRRKALLSEVHEELGGLGCLGVELKVIARLCNEPGTH